MKFGSFSAALVVVIYPLFIAKIVVDTQQLDISLYEPPQVKYKVSSQEWEVDPELKQEATANEVFNDNQISHQQSSPDGEATRNSDIEEIDSFTEQSSTVSSEINYHHDMNQTSSKGDIFNNNQDANNSSIDLPKSQLNKFIPGTVVNGTNETLNLDIVDIQQETNLTDIIAVLDDVDIVESKHLDGDKIATLGTAGSSDSEIDTSNINHVHSVVDQRDVVGSDELYETSSGASSSLMNDPVVDSIITKVELSNSEISTVEKSEKFTYNEINEHPGVETEPNVESKRGSEIVEITLHGNNEPLKDIFQESNFSDPSEPPLSANFIVDGRISESLSHESGGDVHQVESNIANIPPNTAQSDLVGSEPFPNGTNYEFSPHDIGSSLIEGYHQAGVIPPDPVVEKENVANPGTDLDDEKNEIGDPLGEVYFGILKEYLCKMEVVFEKTPRATFVTLVVGVLYIFFVSTKMILRKKSKESQLSAELSNLQSVIHKYSVERNHYNKLLTAERQKTRSLEETISEIKEKYDGYEESMAKVKSERKLFEQECARLKSKFVVEHESFTKMQRENHELEEENSNLKVQLEELTSEVGLLISTNSKVESSLKFAQSEIEVLKSSIEGLRNEKEGFIREFDALNTKFSVVTGKRDELKDRVRELDAEVADLKTQLKRSREELDTLNKSLQELEAIKGSDDPDKQFHDVLDLVQVKVKLSSLSEENDSLSKKVTEYDEALMQLQEEVISLRKKCSESEEMSGKAIAERDEAVKNLEVLTKYFKEREVEMQKELGAQQVRRIQKEEDASSLEKRLQDLEQQNESYRSQCESMRKELADSERCFKSQMAALEKRAHDSWVAARNFERDVVELKNVSAFLRQKLTESAKSSRSGDVSDGSNDHENSSMFHFMPPPLPPGPLAHSLEFMMNSQRPMSSASGPWELGPMPPPPPVPPMAMPFMPAMPPFNPQQSYSDYSNRLSPSSRQSHSPAYSYSADVANGGDQSSLDYSSLNFSQTQHPQEPQNQVYQQQQQQTLMHEKPQYYRHHDQLNL